MRVLLDEDDRKTAGFIRKALQAEGFAVDVLHDGGEALQRVVLRCGWGMTREVFEHVATRSSHGHDQFARHAFP